MVSPVYIRPLLALLVLAAIVGLAAVVFRNGSHESAPVPSATPQLPKNIDVALKNARFSEIQDGVLVWDLVAERVDYDKTGEIAYLSNIRMEFQKTSSQGAMTVTADKGEYFSTKKNVSLTGNVRLVTEEGASFNTASINYNGASSLFTTRSPVVFRQERLQLNAVGMDMNVKTQKAIFKSSVSSSIVMNQVPR